LFSAIIIIRSALLVFDMRLYKDRAGKTRFRPALCCKSYLK
jgi:hypothetical protein